jgi:hypothetical protein
MFSLVGKNAQYHTTTTTTTTMKPENTYMNTFPAYPEFIF